MKDVDVNERSVHHVLRSAARGNLSECDVCILDIPNITVRCFSWFSAKTRKINALHAMKQMCQALN